MTNLETPSHPVSMTPRHRRDGVRIVSRPKHDWKFEATPNSGWLVELQLHWKSWRQNGSWVNLPRISIAMRLKVTKSVKATCAPGPNKRWQFSRSESITNLQSPVTKVRMQVDRTTSKELKPICPHEIKSQLSTNHWNGYHWLAQASMPFHGRSRKAMTNAAATKCWIVLLSACRSHKPSRINPAS